MTHPQSIAEQILKLKHLETIKKYGCCALVFLWCLHIEPDDVEALQIIDDAITAGVIGNDCTVKWAEFGEWLTGRKITVDFIDNPSIFRIKDRTPVRYDYKGNSHWVGVEHGLIAFNPLKSSRCVELGRAMSMRVIHIK